jgi:uncharacterized YccA/Bax inhibitor family protein
MALTMQNPALRETVFDRVRAEEYDAPQTMTVRGTAIKTCWLLAILVAAAGFAWWMSLELVEGGRLHVGPMAGVFMIAGIIGGLVLAMITSFRPKSAPWSAPLYAGFEGLALGGISAFFESFFPGIVIEATALTFGVLAILLMVYAAGLVRATPVFTRIVVAATGAICLVYLADIVLRFFGVAVPFIHETGWGGIGFSLFVVVIASLNLILDFDLIERNANRGAPRFMEWYGGFALLVTLVWLYLEILRLLAKLRSRD